MKEINRRDFFKTSIAATAALTSSCFDDNHSSSYDQPYIQPEFQPIFDSNFLRTTQYLINEIQENAPEHLTTQINQSLIELFDSYASSATGIDPQYKEQITHEPSVEVMITKNHNALYLPDDILFLKKPWRQSPVNDVLKASQMLRHRELITTNQFDVPTQHIENYLYALAMETINQIYGGGMQKAFTGKIKARSVTKYRYGITRPHQYQTMEKPFPKPGSPWMYLQRYSNLATSYFTAQDNPDSFEIGNTGIHIDHNFAYNITQQSPTLSQSIITPTLPYGI